jgi:membrane fusion protein (multidrug efflux system)
MAQVANADFVGASAGTTDGGKSLIPSRHAIKRVAFGLVFAVGLAAAASYAYRYWTVGRFLESTDDAYIQADYTTVAPKVSGYLADVLVTDNESVKAGQVLAHIDDRDFKTALDQARADVAGAESAIRNIDAELALQQSVIDQQKAAIASDEATLKFAQQDRARYADLVADGWATTQRFQKADATLHESDAAAQRDRAGLVAAQKKIAVLTTQRSQAEASRDRAQAIARQAELNLSYTVITAPVDGTVGARSLRVGQLVQAGTQLMAVVPLRAVYVVANFKETQLTEMRQGQPVDIGVDGFPGVALKGHVDSLAPASGQEFALLPPDNATGNFTKIVQRVPVKIVLDEDPLAGVLRPGMSVEPVVDTKPDTLDARAFSGNAAPRSGNAG